jgi:hypothetical protein
MKLTFVEFVEHHSRLKEQPMQNIKEGKWLVNCNKTDECCYYIRINKRKEVTIQSNQRMMTFEHSCMVWDIIQKLYFVFTESSLMK